LAQTVGKDGLSPRSARRLCQQLRPMLLAKLGFFANRTLPTTVASLLAKVTTAELTASPLCQRYTWLLAKLSQHGPRSCWRRALSHNLTRQRFFPNRNSETLLGKTSPTRVESSPTA
jgi:hypothetical protein